MIILNENLKKKWNIISILLILLFTTVSIIVSKFNLRLLTWSLRLIVFNILAYYIILRKFFIKIKFSKCEILIFIYALIALFSSVIINHQYKFRSFYYPFTFVIIFIGIYSIYVSSKLSIIDIIKILWGYVFITSLIFIISIILSYKEIIIFFFNKSNDYHNISMTISTLFYNPNSLGSFLMGGVVATLSLFFYYFTQKNNIKIIILLISFFCILLLGLFLSVSRASILGVICCFLFLFLYLIYKKNFNFIKTTINFLIFMIIISIIFYIFGFWDILITKINKDNHLRIYFWIFFLKDQISNFSFINFIFGKGYYGIVNEITKKLSLHNCFLEVWARFGFVSLCLLLYVYIFQIKKLIKNRNLWFVWGIIIAYLVHELFEIELFLRPLRTQIIFFIIILLLPVNFIENNNT